MAQADKLLYFDLRGRGEPIRMLYALAGETLIDERIPRWHGWPEKKKELPLGQLPVLTTNDTVLCNSTAIARHAARKFGLAGEDSWEETLNDVIVETLQEVIDNVSAKVFSWKVVKTKPEPEQRKELLEDVRSHFLERVAYVQSLSEKRGKKFLISDQIQLADVWTYVTLGICERVYQDSLEITPWVKDFVARFEADERVKKYLAERPESITLHHLGKT